MVNSMEQTACRNEGLPNQAGFILLFAFVLGAVGYEIRGWQRRQEVRENMRRILEEREAARRDEE